MIKKIFFLGIVLLYVTANAENLLSNPGFEEKRPTARWQIRGAVNTTAEKFEGGKALQLRTIKLYKTFKATINQKIVNAQPGKYELSFQIKGDFTFAYTVVSLNGVKKPLLRRFYKYQCTSNNSWSLIKTCFDTGNKDIANIGLEVFTSKKGMNILIDDARLICTESRKRIVPQSVKISDFKPVRSDAFPAIQKALDTGAKKVLFDNPGFDYVVSKTIKVNNSQTLIFADGIKIIAKKEYFKGLNDNLFQISGNNISLIGQGKVEFSMQKKDYQNPKLYARSEWRHGLGILNSENVTIKNLTISKSGGDGLYLNGVKNCLIENVILTDHHRLAGAVISGENVLFKNVKFLYNNGTAPNSGLDMEPNRPYQGLQNIVLENCEFIGNAYYGIVMAVKKLDKVIDVTYKNCKLADNGGGFAFNLEKSASPNKGGIVKIINCYIESREKPIFSPLILRNFRTNGVKLLMRDCVIDNRKNKTRPPIHIDTIHNEDFENIDVGNLVILQDIRRPVFSVIDPGAGAIKPFKGSITIRDKKTEKKVDLQKELCNKYPGDQELKNFKTAFLDLEKFKALSGTPGVAANPALFHANTELIICNKKPQIPLKFITNHPVKNIYIKINVEIEDYQGAIIDKFVIDSKEYTYNFKYQGIFRLRMNGLQRYMIKVETPASGQGFAIDKRRNFWTMNGCVSDFYFVVPASASHIIAEITRKYVPVTVKVFDAQGNLKVSDAICGLGKISIKRSPSAKDEIWKISFAGKWGCKTTLRFAAPIAPILFTATQNIITKK
jgi:hypothetical protein